MIRRLLVLPLIGIAPAVAVGLLAATGAALFDVSGPTSPGRLTQLGLPFIQALRDIAVAFTIGALVVAACCLAPRNEAGQIKLSPPQRRLADWASMAAALWIGCSFLLIALTFSDATGRPVSAPGFWTEASSFAFQFELGRYLVVGIVIALLAGLGAMTCQHPRTLGFVAGLALLGLWPIALSGHGASALNHDAVVNVQFGHLIGVSVWVGGLLALAVVGPRLAIDLPPAVRRYSVLAGWCLLLVAASGVAAALLRLDELDGLWSSFGVLVLLKTAALLALAGFGLLQRRRLISELDQGKPRAFRRLVLLEIAVMLAAAGTAVALSRTPPPVGAGGEARLTAAESVLGYRLPGPLGGAEWFTQWRPDALWLPLAALAVFWYLRAVRRLRRRGDHWPGLRITAWLLGWLLLVWATSGSPGVYGRVLFSMHMVQHMTIATAVPVLLVLGAPVTLALRTSPRRRDGSLGPREWVLALVHAPLTQFLGRPLVAGPLFIISLVVFYYSSLFELALTSHTAHVLMTLHFLVSGYFYASCLVGIDPGLRQPAYPLRVLLVMVTFGFHALFSVSLMASDQVLAESWYEGLQRPWGRSLADDQYLGASLGWALGDYPLALLAGVLVYLWVKADRRESRRFDRQELRENDSQLNSYNDYLARLARQSGGREQP